MQKSPRDSQNAEVKQLAEEAQSQFGEFADEYAEVRAAVAQQLGEVHRSSEWRRAAELIERSEDDDKR